MSCRYAYKPGDGDDSSIVALSSRVVLVIVTLTRTIQHSWWSDPASQMSEGTLGEWCWRADKVLVSCQNTLSLPVPGTIVNLAEPPVTWVHWESFLG